MQTYNFEFSVAGASVASDEGVIRGVSIITSGILAKGHDLEVDHTTLAQMQACAKKKGKVPVKWNHKTGADAVNGYLNNFRIDGNKLKADWHLLKTHERYAHALELAEEMPESIGLSASFMGKDQEKDGRKFARCSDLVSVDLVATPAANPDGLFEARVDSGGNGMADKSTQTGAAAAKEFTLADVMAGITNLDTAFKQLSQRQDTIERFFTDPGDDDEPDPSDESDESDLSDEADPSDDGDDGADITGQFASVQDCVRYLEARLNGIEQAKQRAESERAFATIEDRMTKLLELNQQLVAENSAMAEAINEFSSHTGATVEFSAGKDGGYEPHVMVAGEGREAPRTEFEARVQQLQADGKEEPDAIMLAMKESPARYQKYLQAIGVRAKSL